MHQLFVGNTISPVTSRRTPTHFGLVAALVCLLHCGHVTANDEASLPSNADRDTVSRSVSAVSDSVVRVRVIGGQQDIDGQPVQSLVTTGIVISESGEILTSAFATAGGPESILVEDPAGNRHNAQLLATDHVRQISLLRCTSGTWTPVRVADPIQAVTGQYAIALGRFYPSAQPSISVGIISALSRIDGLAIQTDAKVSPVNYGGPLISLDGEVFGILVPLSPGGSRGDSSGIEWYDSGIGFAIPLADALKSAGRLRDGTDLLRGRVGLNLRSPSPFSDRVWIDAVLPGSPAATAGLQKDDRVIEIAGNVVRRRSTVESAIAASYAGDPLDFIIERDGRQQSLQVIPVESLQPPPQSWLGLIPPAKAVPPVDTDEKARPKAENTAEFLRMHVIPGGPVAASGCPETIEIRKMNEQPVAELRDLILQVAQLPPDTMCSLEWRAPETEAWKTTIVTTVIRPESPAALPDDFPRYLKTADRIESDEVKPGSPVVGGVDRSELINEPFGRCTLLRPVLADATPCGLIVMLSSHDTSEEQILDQWRTVMQSHALMLMLVQNPEKTALSSVDLPLIARGLQQALTSATINPGRVVALAQQNQIPLAWQMASSQVSTVRGFVVTSGSINPLLVREARSPRSIPILQRLSEDSAENRILAEESVQQLRKAGFPLTLPIAESNLQQSVADWTILLQSY